jgi:hypothetical protein
MKSGLVVGADRQGLLIAVEGSFAVSGTPAPLPFLEEGFGLLQSIPDPLLEVSETGCAVRPREAFRGLAGPGELSGAHQVFDGFERILPRRTLFLNPAAGFARRLPIRPIKKGLVEAL